MLSNNDTNAGGLTGNPSISVSSITTNNNNINAGTGTITAATFSGNLSGNATTATTATTATNATNATNANYANSAGSATNATNANYANSAGTANNAISKFTGDPRGMNLNEGLHLPTYLGFGATYWHTQNYASIQTLHVSGDQPAFSLYINSGNAWVRMYYNGGLAMNTGWTQGSDIRIKFDINKIEDNECLSIIRNISMYKYKLKESRQQKKYGKYMNYGFIAQEVLNYLPQSVSAYKSGIPSIHKSCTIIDDILELDDIDDYTDKYGNIFKYEYEAKIDDILELVLYGDLPRDDKEGLKLRITQVITNKKFRIAKLDKEIDYTKKWFVYGNIVDDLLSLEHSMIHNVGIGAIKCIDKEVTNLKNEIDLLKEENQILKNKLNIISNHIGIGNLF